MKPVILNLEPTGYSSKARDRLSTLAEVIDHVGGEPDAADLARADVIITRLARYIDEVFLRRCSRLSAIATATTGLNHVELAAAERRGIEILSLRGESAFLASISATAELHWGLLIAIARHLVPAFTSVQAGEWDRDRFQGMQLAGRTIGIIGYGRLGRLVAGYARAFRMKVLAFDKLPSADEGVTFCGLEELLRESDILSVHLSLTEDSRQFLDRTKLAMARPGVLLVNTARGEVWDEAAVAELVVSGHIAAVATDVLIGEAEDRGSFLPRSPLWSLARTNPRVLITPHVGGACPEAMRATEEFIADKIMRFLSAKVSSGESFNVGQ